MKTISFIQHILSLSTDEVKQRFKGKCVTVTLQDGKTFGGRITSFGESADKNGLLVGFVFDEETYIGFQSIVSLEALA